MKKPATRLAHLGNRPFENHGVINPPVYHASTIAFETLDALKTRHKSKDPRAVSYGRHGTPTTHAVEETVAELEGGAGAMAVSSGLAAVSLAMMSQLRPGDHVLVSDSVYSPVRKLCDEVLAALDIRCDYFQPTIGEGIGELLTPQTRLVYLESPGSHTFEITDVPGVMRALEGRDDIVTVFDNTWATPLFFRPFDHGVDIVVHAATKYLGGHSDLMMGIAVCNERTHASVKRYRDLVGHCAAPDDAYLVQRGIRTLDVRLERHRRNGLILAKWLEARPEVVRVIHPELPSHPQHATWKRDFSGSNGLFSFILDADDEGALATFLEALELFAMGASWGGYESLALPFEVSRYRSVAPLPEAGFLVRLHAGLEDPEDLIQDLEAGFERMNAWSSRNP